MIYRDSLPGEGGRIQRIYNERKYEGNKEIKNLLELPSERNEGESQAKCLSPK